MQDNELKFYESIGNWDFSEIKYTTEKITNWDFYEEIKKYTNENSLCLDIGTGGGEKVIKKYPEVAMIIASDFSKEMIKTAKENLKKSQRKNIKFVMMDNLNMNFPNDMFDLVSARHTIIDAKQIYNCLVDGGTLIIEGIDRKDCWELKELFGRGQGFKDEMSIAKKDYQDLKDAGFSKIKEIEILYDEYYETIDDLVALLLKTPILDNFSEIENNSFIHNPRIEKELLDEYVKKYKTPKGILLKRRLYGIISEK